MEQIINVYAEQMVLGIVLSDGDLFHELTIEEKHLGESRHRMIYQAMERVVEQEEAIDLVTVTTELGNDIYAVGGTKYLLELAEAVVSTAPLKKYEQFILDAYRLRASRKYMMDYIDWPSQEKLADLMEHLEAFQEVGMHADEKSVREYLLEIADEMSGGDGGDAQVLTEVGPLDELTGGFQKGDLVVIAARPSVGKTAFALQLATAHAKAGGSVHLFSLEMGVGQLLKRMISKESGINSQKWRHHVFSKEDYEKAYEVMGELSTWSLHMYDSLLSVSEIRAEVSRRRKERPDDQHLVIIDYLQLLQPDGSYERRDLEVGAMTRELKQFALQHEVPVVLLSQLSRNVESRKNNRPILSDLRESGNIEQDADVVLFLHRDDYYGGSRCEVSDMDVIVAKHRNGPTGSVAVRFDRECGRFEGVS